MCAEYLIRPKTAYEHAWEVRDLLEPSEFSKHEQEVRDHLAARVWPTIEGPRALFDRAVVHLLREGILLPAGITTLNRLISEVRRAEHARLYRTPAKRAGPELRARLADLPQVPADRRVSELERLAEPRKTATLLAITRSLQAEAVDDALDLFAPLMATRRLQQPMKRGSPRVLPTGRPVS
ncbi:DUF4158 domain-containing protein [Streptosporangium carneum]|uniref:DUF4158 domain-containing protein n=1 Tax=Streptosporangium carneum TaxID=47481 RepID=A0A9W6I6G7_9ACTN|nr:DUF4158 domain-containing protein [Streptosporangium carneum]GLK12562.1 hypothetical protein GCM10017600_59720 [Streptosporangium carneum]